MKPISPTRLLIEEQPGKGQGKHELCPHFEARPIVFGIGQDGGVPISTAARNAVNRVAQHHLLPECTA